MTIYGMITETIEYYNPDPGGLMQSGYEIKKQKVKTFNNKESFIKAYSNLSNNGKNKTQCFKGYFFTPDITISMSME